MQRVMIDLETLSTRPDALVLAIGAALFDCDRVLHRAEVRLDMTMDRGHIDPKTIAWWLMQDPEVFRTMTSGHALPADVPGSPLFSWLETADEVWANSPTFDCVILANWCERNGIRRPWSFRAERDCRTMYAIANRLMIPLAMPEGLPLHSAAADAERQALHLLTIERELGLRGALEG